MHSSLADLMSRNWARCKRCSLQNANLFEDSSNKQPMRSPNSMDYICKLRNGYMREDRTLTGMHICHTEVVDTEPRCKNCDRPSALSMARRILHR